MRDYLRESRIFQLRRVLELRAKVHDGEATPDELRELARVEGMLGPLSQLGRLTGEYLEELEAGE